MAIHDNEKHDEKKESMVPKKVFIYKNLLVTSAAAFFNFTAFGGLQNLESSLHKEKGFVSLCVLYASFLVASFFLPNVMMYRFGYKYSLIASISGFTMFTLVQFYPKLWLMIIASVITGKIFSYSNLTILLLSLTK